MEPKGYSLGSELEPIGKNQKFAWSKSADLATRWRHMYLLRALITV